LSQAPVDRCDSTELVKNEVPADGVGSRYFRQAETGTPSRPLDCCDPAASMAFNGCQYIIGQPPLSIS
jgi:hypothetical protein